MNHFIGLKNVIYSFLLHIYIYFSVRQPHHRIMLLHCNITHTHTRTLTRCRLSLYYGTKNGGEGRAMIFPSHTNICFILIGVIFSSFWSYICGATSKIKCKSVAMTVRSVRACASLIHHKLEDQHF